LNADIYMPAHSTNASREVRLKPVTYGHVGRWVVIDFGRECSVRHMKDHFRLRPDKYASEIALYASRESNDGVSAVVTVVVTVPLFCVLPHDVTL
jgi:hypothetical protein